MHHTHSRTAPDADASAADDDEAMLLLTATGLFFAFLHSAEKVKADVVEMACLIELPALKGRDRLGGTPLHVLIEMEGE